MFECSLIPEALGGKTAKERGREKEAGDREAPRGKKGVLIGGRERGRED